MILHHTIPLLYTSMQENALQLAQFQSVKLFLLWHLLYEGGRQMHSRCTISPTDAAPSPSYNQATSHTLLSHMPPFISGYISGSADHVKPK